jgi:hypothetical protein
MSIVDWLLNPAGLTPHGFLPELGAWSGLAPRRFGRNYRISLFLGARVSRSFRAEAV